MTVKVFVGCAANGEDAESCAVLEWTLRKHTTEPVDVVWMAQSRNPACFWHGFDTSAWATPFSGFRWAIPAYCGFEGKAIYCDSDVIFMADVAELWNQEFEPGKAIMGKGGGSWRFCVSMWDCATAEVILPSLAEIRGNAFTHNRMGQLFRGAPWVQAFEGDWNCLDGGGYASLHDPAIKVIHYTDMSCQPHLRYALPRLAAEGERHWFDGQVRAHPRRDLELLFDNLLLEARDHGYGVGRYIPVEPFGEYRKTSLANYRGRA